MVKEELSTAVMRRISENDIKILPVLKEPCEIPSPLRHLRYADFSDNSEEALSNLLESLFPGINLWQALSHLYDHFCLLYNNIVNAKLDDEASDKILELFSLLESALNLRTEIEFYKTRQKMLELNFFKKIGFLAYRGVDVRSKTWIELVKLRAMLAHSMRPPQKLLHMLAQELKTV